MDRQGAKDAKFAKPPQEHEEPGIELDRLARSVIGAGIEVHRELGPGYHERVYEEALRIELRLRRIQARFQVPIELAYKGIPVGRGRIDCLVEGKLVVELKAVEALAPAHRAQLISYLRASGLRLGLLINFNVPLLRQGIMRVISS